MTSSPSCAYTSPPLSVIGTPGGGASSTSVSVSALTSVMPGSLSGGLRRRLAHGDRRLRRGGGLLLQALADVRLELAAEARQRGRQRRHRRRAERADGGLLGR